MKMFIFLVVNFTLLISSVYLQQPDCRIGSPDPNCNQNKGTNKIDGQRNVSDYYKHPNGKTWCKKRYPDIICVQTAMEVCADDKLRRLCCHVCRKPTQNTGLSKRPSNWNICMICLRYPYFCLESDWKTFGCEAFEYLNQRNNMPSAEKRANPQGTSNKTRMSSNTGTATRTSSQESQSPKQCLKPNAAKPCLQIDQAILCSVHYMKWSCCQNCV